MHFLFAINCIVDYFKQVFNLYIMKEYDRVELIEDNLDCIKRGIKKGDKGIILGPKRHGYWLVYFDGEIFQDVDGVWKTTEIDAAVKEEDVKVIEE